MFIGKVHTTGFGWNAAEISRRSLKMRRSKRHPRKSYLVVPWETSEAACLKMNEAAPSSTASRNEIAAMKRFLRTLFRTKNGI